MAMYLLRLCALSALASLAACVHVPSAPEGALEDEAGIAQTLSDLVPNEAIVSSGLGAYIAPEGSAQLGTGLKTPKISDATPPIDRPDARAIYQQGLEDNSLSSDLWQRMREQFALPDLDGALVKQHEQWYAKRAAHTQRMVERSRKYLFHIVEELELRGMPAELALLPYIESAFNPQAVSPVKAAGMWQFMPATGTNFNLKQNVLRDDRRDVLASTRAALDYLQYLHRMFDDWHLALAAYNWGEGNVSRAIRNNRKAGKPTNYAALKMPAETRNYVPKLQAMKNIVANPEKFKIELPHIENHPYFQILEIERDMDADLIAKLADISIEDFHALNPAHKKPVLFAAGSPRILLPWDNANVFTQNLEALAEGQLASWTVWLAPHAMTTAEAARRTGMDEDELRRVNLIPAGAKIQSGSALVVPRTAENALDVSYDIAQSANLSLISETAAMRKITVRARAGDTMGKIAARHKVSVANLAQWNKLSPTAKLKPKQTLVIYQAVKLKATAKKSTTKNTKKPSTQTASKKPAKPQTKSTTKTTAKPAAKTNAIKIK